VFGFFGLGFFGFGLGFFEFGVRVSSNMPSHSGADAVPHGEKELGVHEEEGRREQICGPTGQDHLFAP
jgi:hypothetical protein